MPQGPAGGPRPLASTSVVVEATTQDQFESADEVVIESGVRRSTDFPQAEVTVSEDFQGPGETTTVILNEEYAIFDDLIEIFSIIHNSYPSIEKEDVMVRVPSPTGPVGGPRIFAKTAIKLEAISGREVRRETIEDAERYAERRIRTETGEIIDVRSGVDRLSAFTNKKSVNLLQLDDIRSLLREAFLSTNIGPPTVLVGVV